MPDFMHIILETLFMNVKLLRKVWIELYSAYHIIWWENIFRLNKILSKAGKKLVA